MSRQPTVGSRTTLLTALLRAAVLLAIAGAPLHAQRAAIVPTTDLVYQDIDRLSELGALDGIIMGQRPYSRGEFVRIVREATKRLDEQSRDVGGERSLRVQGLLRRIASQLGNDMEGNASEAPIVRLFDGAALSYVNTNAVRRGFPSPSASPTEATIDPLATRRLGRPAARGQAAALELSQLVAPTSWLAIQARERVEYRGPRDSTLSHTDGEVLLAFARARYRNAALTVGRQALAWSQGTGDGLFLASDAPALDQVSLASDQPFALPWLLRWLGPTQATLVLADLGPSVVRSGSRLLTYKVSIQPANAVELGGTFMDHFAGTGARSSSARDQLIDFLPFIDIFRKHNYTDSTHAIDVDSDKLLGVDGRVRIDPLGGLLLTGELLIDDFDVHRIPQLLTGYGSQTLGVIIPSIGSPALSARFSVKHMGIITYTHNQLSNGITTRGRLLGDELGPDAKRYAATVRWSPFTELRMELEGRSSLYSDGTYGAFYSDAAGTRYVVQKLSSRPNEQRDAIIGTMIVQTGEGVAFTARAGAERTRNAFDGGGRRRSYLAEVGLRLGQ